MTVLVTSLSPRLSTPHAASPDVPNVPEAESREFLIEPFGVNPSWYGPMLSFGAQDAVTDLRPVEHAGDVCGSLRGAPSPELNSVPQ